MYTYVRARVRASVENTLFGSIPIRVKAFSQYFDESSPGETADLYFPK